MSLIVKCSSSAETDCRMIILLAELTGSQKKIFTKINTVLMYLIFPV